MHRSLRSILFAIAFSLAAFSAIPALAAPAAWEKVDVTLHAEQDGSVLLVSGQLPEKTPLPATAELSVPAGSELQWLGEILGGPPAEDPELKYTKTTADGVDIYRFTLTKVRTAQAEIPMKAGQLFDGTTYTSSVAWASAQDVPEVRLSLRVPDGAKPVLPAAGAVLKPGDSGYSFYSKTVKNVKAGDKLDLKLVYTLPAVGGATSSGAKSTTAGSSSNSGVTVLALFVAVIAVALGVFMFSRRNKAATATSGVKPAVKPAGKQTSRSATKADPSEGELAEKAAGMSGTAKRNLVTAAIIGILIIGTAVVGNQTTKPKLVGDTITEVFAQGEACANATIPLSLPEGADHAATAKSLFTVLRPIANTATYNAKTSTLEIGYCESKSSEAALRAALAPTGLVAQGTAAP